MSLLNKHTNVRKITVYYGTTFVQDNDIYLSSIKTMNYKLTLPTKIKIKITKHNI